VANCCHGAIEVFKIGFQEPLPNGPDFQKYNSAQTGMLCCVYYFAVAFRNVPYCTVLYCVVAHNVGQDMLVHLFIARYPSKQVQGRHLLGTINGQCTHVFLAAGYNVANGQKALGLNRERSIQANYCTVQCKQMQQTI
jgi:hypothetical protein